MASKKYGLILPDKSKHTPVFNASRNVFGEDSDSEDEKNKKLPLLRPSDSINRQAKATQEKAVLEDPTVYQYDEIYEQMSIKKDEKKIKSKDEKKPQYIENLIKTATKRKIENERRVERQIQKEREKEGDEFKDKEVFVTSAYKKKLEEMKLEEEREKREEYLENIGDVTKQKDLGGFYRHLYEQKLGKDKATEHKEKPDLDTDKNIDINEEKCSVDVKTKGNSKDKTSELSSITSQKRNYRKRKSSADSKKELSDGEIEDSDEEINRVNLDDIKKAKKSKQNEENIDEDSDFLNDETSDEEAKNNGNVIESSDKPSCKKETTPHIETFKKPSDVVSRLDKSKDTLGTTEEPKPIKIDIWKKRTVGEVFDQALKRYYERKVSRGR